MKRIFYCNITYGCNSNCIFCYSHNTQHNKKTYNEISAVDFMKYLEKNNINENDRVIINGGEPLLHSEIQYMFEVLKKYKCEVLIYTNGRILDKIDVSGLDGLFRFIVPIHGYRELHDSITGVKGSFDETINGLSKLYNSNCKTDVKVIINYEMIENEDNFKKTVNTFDKIPFNNAVHITKMANTIIAEKNKCKSIDNDLAAIYTKKIYDYYKDKKCIIKIFDTCVKTLDLSGNIENYTKFKVFFKDKNYEKSIELKTPDWKCYNDCTKKEYCKSAFNEYLVLEFYENKIYEGIE